MQAPSFIPANQSASPALAAWLFMAILAVDVEWPRAVHVSSTTPALPLQSPVQLPYARGLTMGVHDALALQPATGGAYVATEWGYDAVAKCADGAPASVCVAYISQGSPLNVQTSAAAAAVVGDEDATDAAPQPYTPRAWRLWTAPLLGSGFALLGELFKAVRVSPDRFSFLEASPLGFSAALRVAAGENVSVAVLVPPSSGLGDDAPTATIEIVEVIGSPNESSTATRVRPASRHCSRPQAGPRRY